MKKGKINPVSKIRKEWLKQYNEHFRNLKKIWGKENPYPCARCYKFFNINEMDRHHVYGRGSLEKLLNYIMVCRPCHDWIENNKREAEEEGFIKREREPWNKKPDSIFCEDD